MSQVKTSQAVTFLNQIFNVGDTVYTVRMRPADNGNKHMVKVLAVVDGRIEDITSSVAKACGLVMGRNFDTVRVSYCQDVAEHISRVLFGMDFKLRHVAL